MSAQQIARQHHFVPKFLLRNWALDSQLTGYWWDAARKTLRCKHLGTGGFCFREHLLTVCSPGARGDFVERVFGEIDDRGSKALKIILEGGPDSLSDDQRCDFARLLMSLEVRRPESVKHLRAEVTRRYKVDLDGDPTIRQAMAAAEQEGPASEFYERDSGVLLEDRAVALTIKLTDNKLVGEQLIGASWHVVHLGSCDGTLLLSDRPLIRIYGYDHPSAQWYLPLTPTALFVAVGRVWGRKTPRRMAKEINRYNVCRADRYVFSVEKSHEALIEKYLRRC